jgi:Protein of unknown function (DUF3180)
MKRTTGVTVAVLALVSAGAGWLVEIALAATGRPIFIPPVSLAIALAVIGGLVVVVALPVRRAVQGKPGAQRVDPFYASRVAALAKASSIGGSLLAGVAVGVLVFLLSRTVIAASGSITAAVLAVVGAAILVAGGLIGEHFCAIPPHDDEPHNDAPVTQRL